MELLCPASESKGVKRTCLLVATAAEGRQVKCGQATRRGSCGTPPARPTRGDGVFAALDGQARGPPARGDEYVLALEGAAAAGAPHAQGGCRQQQGMRRGGVSRQVGCTAHPPHRGRPPRLPHLPSGPATATVCASTRLPLPSRYSTPAFLSRLTYTPFRREISLSLPASSLRQSCGGEVWRPDGGWMRSVWAPGGRGWGGELTCACGHLELSLQERGPADLCMWPVGIELAAAQCC